MNDLKTNFDFSKLLDNDHLSTNISVGAQIIFESSFDDDLILNDDNFCYIIEAAQHFKLQTIESDCNVYIRTRMINGNSIETLIICERYFKKFKGTLNLWIKKVSKIFHKLSDNHLFDLSSKYLILILNQNYKFECNEYEILEIILKWMVNYGEFPN